jgi:hypothetical protein
MERWNGRQILKDLIAVTTAAFLPLRRTFAQAHSATIPNVQISAVSDQTIRITVFPTCSSKIRISFPLFFGRLLPQF